VRSEILFFFFFFSPFSFSFPCAITPLSNRADLPPPYNIILFFSLLFPLFLLHLLILILPTIPHVLLIIDISIPPPSLQFLTTNLPPNPKSERLSNEAEPFPACSTTFLIYLRIRLLFTLCPKFELRRPSSEGCRILLLLPPI
jgi:hypothetical protein